MHNRNRCTVANVKALHILIITREKDYKNYTRKVGSIIKLTMTLRTQNSKLSGNYSLNVLYMHCVMHELVYNNDRLVEPYPTYYTVTYCIHQ